jgi:hypothetical protein
MGDNMNRITRQDLESVVNRINQITGSPEHAWEIQADGIYKALIGNYHLPGAYGGVSLHRMVNARGGVEDVFRCGHVTKRDLYNRMQAFITGLERK